MFFIMNEIKEAILDFSQGAVKVFSTTSTNFLWFFTLVLIQNDQVS